MKNKPVVSVIVPIYNVEPYLKQCVDSIRNQTVHEIEIILIDDGSSDGCPQMCDQFAEEDERILVVHQLNAGPSAARNRGIEAAGADWLMFVDADDWLENNAIEILYEQVRKSSYDIICTHYMDDYGHKQKIVGMEREYYVEENLTLLLSSTLGLRKSSIDLRGSCGNFYRRSMIDHYHCRFCSELKMREDSLFNLYTVRCAQKIFILSTPIYHYRKRPYSLTHTISPDQQEMFHLYRTQIRLFMEKYHLQKELQAAFQFTTIHNILSSSRVCGMHINSLEDFFGNVELIKNISEEQDCVEAINAAHISSIAGKMDKIGCCFLKLRMYKTIMMICFIYEKILQKRFAQRYKNNRS